MKQKSLGLKIAGVIGILSVACCAIAWIGLIISPPWAAELQNCVDDDAE